MIVACRVIPLSLRRVHPRQEESREFNNLQIGGRTHASLCPSDYIYEAVIPNRMQVLARGFRRTLRIFQKEEDVPATIILRIFLRDRRWIGNHLWFWQCRIIGAVVARSDMQRLMEILDQMNKPA